MPLENPESKTSQLLAALIVAYRTLGYDKEAAKSAMQELAKRQAAGDTFDYNEFIDKHCNSIKTNVTEKDGQEFIQTISNIGKFLK